MSDVNVTPPRERVALGLLASLIAVVGGVVLTVVIYRAGFIAGITSFVIALGASFLYAWGAGSPPRRGLVPLIVLILLGVVVSFFSIVASDLVDAHDGLFPPGSGGPGTVEFVRDNLFNTDVLSTYGKSIAFFAVFAALGVFGTIRRLVSAR